MVESGQEASRPSTHASAHRKEIHRLELPQHKKSMLGRALFYVGRDLATGSETSRSLRVWMTPG